MVELAIMRHADPFALRFDEMSELVPEDEALDARLAVLRKHRVASASFDGDELCSVTFQPDEPASTDHASQRDTSAPPVKRTNPHAGGLVPRGNVDRQ